MTHVETHSHGEIVEIKLARAPVNALDPKLCNAAREALESAVHHGAQAIVLSGGPKVFSAGLDVPYLLTLDAAGLREAWEAFFLAARALAASPVPVVSAVGHETGSESGKVDSMSDWRSMMMASATPFINLLSVIDVI